MNNSKVGKARTEERNHHLYTVNGSSKSPTLSAPRLSKRRIPKYLKLVAAVLGLYLAALFVTGSYQLWQLKNQVKVLDIEQKYLLQQQQTLTNEIEALSSPEVIERIARESLRMVRPGETVIIPAAEK